MLPYGSDPNEGKQMKVLNISFPPIEVTDDSEAEGIIEAIKEGEYTPDLDTLIYTVTDVKEQ